MPHDNADEPLHDNSEPHSEHAEPREQKSSEDRNGTRDNTGDKPTSDTENDRLTELATPAESDAREAHEAITSQDSPTSQEYSGEQAKPKIAEKPGAAQSKRQPDDCTAEPAKKAPSKQPDPGKFMAEWRALADKQAESLSRTFELSDADDYVPTDLFGPLTQPRTRVTQVDEESVARWTRRLRSDRVLLLEAIDSALLYEIGPAIGLQCDAWGEAKQLLLFDETRERITIRDILSWQTGARDTLLVVYATSKESSKFLCSLKPDTPAVDAVRMQLVRQKVFLLILCRSDLLQDAVTRNNNEKFPFAEAEPVAFLTPRLRAVYGSESSAMAATIEGQRAKGLWPTKEGEFLKAIKEYIENGQLIDEVRGRSHTAARGEAAVAGTDTLSGSVILSHAGALDRWVLLTATFFKDLSFDDFSNLVKVVASDPADTGREVGGPVSYVPLWQEWTHHPQPLLERCRLFLERHPRGSPLVRFIDEDVRKTLRETFTSSHYNLYRQACENIECSDLLLDASAGVRRAIVEFLAERAVNEPNEFGSRVMERLLLAPLNRAAAKRDFRPAAIRLTQLDENHYKVLVSQVAEVLTNIVERDHEVGRTCFDELRRLNIIEPALQLVRRADRRDEDAFAIALAARLLFGAADENTRRDIRRTLRKLLQEDETGQLLETLLQELQETDAATLLAHCCLYAIQGYREGPTANPVAVALARLAAGERQHSTLETLADRLTCGQFSARLLSDEIDVFVFGYLFGHWILQDHLRDELELLGDLTERALAGAWSSFGHGFWTDSLAANTHEKERCRALAVADLIVALDNCGTPDVGGELLTLLTAKLAEIGDAQCNLRILLGEMRTAIRSAQDAMRVNASVRLGRDEYQAKDKITKRWRHISSVLLTTERKLAEQAQRHRHAWGT